MKADRDDVLRLLKTARGQVDGLIKMVEDDRYCMEISNQLLATQAILKNINRKVMEAHLKSCVKEAFESGDADEKISEIVKMMDKLSK